jgi:hypothetical protein
MADFFPVSSGAALCGEAMRGQTFILPTGEFKFLSLSALSAHSQDIKRAGHAGLLAFLLFSNCKKFFRSRMDGFNGGLEMLGFSAANVT